MVVVGVSGGLGLKRVVVVVVGHLNGLQERPGPNARTERVKGQQRWPSRQARKAQTRPRNAQARQHRKDQCSSTTPQVEDLPRSQRGGRGHAASRAAQAPCLCILGSKRIHKQITKKTMNYIIKTVIIYHFPIWPEFLSASPAAGMSSITL